MLGKVLGFMLTRRQAYRLVMLHAVVTRGKYDGRPGQAVSEATGFADELAQRDERDHQREEEERQRVPCMVP